MIFETAKKRGPAKKVKMKAQALVEFALALSILLLLVIGVFDLYQLFFTKIVINNAAREGAYYLSIHPSDVTKCVVSADPPYCYKGTIEVVLRESENSGVVIDPYLVNPVITGGAGDPVEVKIQHVVDLNILDLFAGPVQLTSMARMVQQ